MSSVLFHVTIIVLLLVILGLLIFGGVKVHQTVHDVKAKASALNTLGLRVDRINALLDKVCGKHIPIVGQLC